MGFGTMKSPFSVLLCSNLSDEIEPRDFISIGMVTRVFDGWDFWMELLYRTRMSMASFSSFCSGVSEPTPLYAWEKHGVMCRQLNFPVFELVFGHLCVDCRASQTCSIAHLAADWNMHVQLQLLHINSAIQTCATLEPKEQSKV